MKRIFTLFLTAILVFAGASAQQTDISKAVKKYKSANTLTTRVKQTRHNAALTKDAVSEGSFYYKKPNSVSMVFKEAKEMLLATGDTYTMVKSGKQHVAKADGKGDNPFEVLGDVLRNLLSGEANSKLTNMADVKQKTQGNTCTITITPTVTDAKLKRKMMYSSCILTIDLKAGEVRSLRINEKGENYTLYDFSNYVFNGDINSKVFDPKIVM